MASSSLVLLRARSFNSKDSKLPTSANQRLRLSAAGGRRRPRPQCALNNHSNDGNKNFLGDRFQSIAKLVWLTGVGAVAGGGYYYWATSNGGNGNGGGIGTGDGNGGGEFNTRGGASALEAGRDDSDDDDDSDEEASSASSAVDDDDDDDDDVDEDDDASSYDKLYCAEIITTDLQSGPGMPTRQELFQDLNCKPQKYFTKEDLQKDIQTLLSAGLFQNVEAKVEPMKAKKGYRINFQFEEKVWPAIVSFQLSGAELVPREITKEVMNEVSKYRNCTVNVLARAKQIIEDWYHERGFVFSTVTHFDGMETGRVVANVVEGKIKSVNSVFVINEDGETSPNGNVENYLIERESPFQIGQVYNQEDGRKALRDIFALQLFDNVQVVPKPDDVDQDKVSVDILLHERPPKTAEIEAEWSIAPGDTGKPSLVSLRPGGNIFFEHRNIGGQNRQLSGSISTTNFFSPQDDVGFKLEYVHPYILSNLDKNKTSLRVSGFNSRKLCPAFIGGPGVGDVPPIWVDRQGVKTALAQNYTAQSRGSFGLVLQEITTRDEAGNVTAQANIPASGQMVPGPPTTHSDTGRDRVLFFQGSFVRDNTKFINGGITGARDVLQIEQGLGKFGGGGPLFNRHQLSLTRFIQLLGPNPRSELPPLVLVGHMNYAGCVGDLAAYDAFTLGGPNSVRGYNVGELGTCRRKLETAVELRVPVPYLKTHAYCFYEQGSDLGSSKEVRGNLTEVLKRVGYGNSYGVGIRLGAVRCEYDVDGNASKGYLQLRFGERF